VVLSGWKEIAQYLGCGVRTAQRWQAEGLPVNRRSPGKRSHVIAQSEQLDSWIQDSAFWRSGTPLDYLANIERARKLRAEVQRGRKNLHLNVAVLRKELATLRSRRRQKVR